MQTFLYQMSSSVFLFASWTCTKTLKTSKNYDHECLKIFFCSLHLLWWLKCQKKNDHFSQKRYFYQKLSRKNVSSFPKSYFDINQTCQIVLTQNRYFWNFNATGLLYLSLKFGEKLWSYKTFHKIEVWKKLDQVMTKKFFVDTILDKIFGKNRRKLSKTGQN